MANNKISINGPKKTRQGKSANTKLVIRVAAKTARKLQKHIVKNTVDRGGANEG